ncbi:MAG TPA: hypothetical protein ENN66_10210 [Proteobacteria bacterium]|nr:hypothetical protein [Pseudomonadota bacterium]
MGAVAKLLVCRACRLPLSLKQGAATRFSHNEELRGSSLFVCGK